MRSHRLPLAAVLTVFVACQKAPTPAPTATTTNGPTPAHPVATPVAQPVAQPITGAAPAVGAVTANVVLPGSDNASLTVSSPGRSSLIAQGSEAPRFRATGHNNIAFESAGPRAKPLVVYFYPRDETPGCTVEAQGFRDASGAYASAGVDVIGVSTDSAEAHRAFATNQSLNFALVPDPDGRLATAFGVAVNGGYARRITFLIDRTGHVARVFENVTPRGHADEVLAAARAL